MKVRWLVGIPREDREYSAWSLQGYPGKPTTLSTIQAIPTFLYQFFNTYDPDSLYLSSAHQEALK